MRRTAQSLRREFDRAFAEAPTAALDLSNFLAVRVAGQAYAVRLADVAGLFADRRVVSMPSALPALLGMASFRGQVTPVFDLAFLLGYERQAAPRWVMLLRASDPVGAAFDEFEKHLAATPDQLLESGARPEAGPQARRKHLRGAVRAGGLLRPIIEASSLLEDIHRRVEATRATMER